MTNDLLCLSHSLSNFVVGMEGNVSKKHNDGLIIKASGSSLKKLTSDDLVEYDFNGNQLSNLQKKGSMELDFHTYLISKYKFNFVSHTHPTNTLKILVTDKIYDFANKRFFPDQVIFNGKKSCVVPYAKPGKPLLSYIEIHLEEFIKKENYFPNVILLKNHGIICCGNTIEECLYSTEICEKSAEIFLNNPNCDFFNDYEIEELLNDDKEKYRKSLV
jgi:L-fuculose-phosphate aldolase